MTPTGPACGRCNYLVEGLPTLICPECGSDLRQVGIRMPSNRKTQGIAGPLFAAALLVFVPIIMLSCVVRMDRVSMSRTIEFKPFWYDQRSNSLQSFSVTGAGSRTFFMPMRGRVPEPVQTITFIITVAGHSTSTLNADIHGMYWPGNAPPRRLDQTIAMAWLKKAGLDPATPRASRLADDIVACIPAIREDGMEAAGVTDLHADSQRYTSRGGSIHWPVRILWLFGGVLWVFLAWHIWRLKDRPLRSVPRCGRCWCEAERFTTAICPQCGGDAREYGIRVSERHRWSGLAGPLVLCAVLVLGIGSVTGAALDSIFWQYNLNTSAQFHPQFDRQPKEAVQLIGISAAGSQLQIGSGHNASFIPDRLLLTVQIKHNRAVIASIEPNGSWRYPGKDGQPIERRWSESEVLGMLKSAGLDPADIATRQLSQDILRNVSLSSKGAFDQIRFGGLSRASSGQGAAGSDAAWLADLQWLFWLMVWIIFVILEFRHNKRRQQRLFCAPTRDAPAGANVTS